MKSKDYYKKHNFKEGILVAFGEIFLKSEGVQKQLKKQLLKNIFSLLKKKKIICKVSFFRERIFIETKDFRKTADVLKRVFGVVWRAKVYFFEDAGLHDVSVFIKDNYADWVKEKESFALRIQKGGDMREKREDIIDSVAKNIKREVNLSNPKKEIFIERRKEGWFIYFKKHKCLRGLPVGSEGKVISLVSGGIDSPVASYLMAGRGVENIWIHFHSFPLVSMASIEKTRELAKIFLNYQPMLKVYFVPFSEIQKEIKIKIDAKYRVLVYRRIMFKIAQKLAKAEMCEGLVTGESLGQVSSQTLPNIQITQEKIKIPILRPLIGMDKEDIISLAEQCNFFKVSIKPQGDCCTLFVPKHQTAAGSIKAINEMEKCLDAKQLIATALKEKKVEIFK